MVALSALPLENDADWRLAGSPAMSRSRSASASSPGRSAATACRRKPDAAAASSSGVPAPLHKQAGMVGRVAASSYRRQG